MPDRVSFSQLLRAPGDVRVNGVSFTADLLASVGFVEHPALSKWVGPGGREFSHEFVDALVCQRSPIVAVNTLLVLDGAQGPPRPAPERRA